MESHSEFSLKSLPELAGWLGYEACALGPAPGGGGGVDIRK